MDTGEGASTFFGAAGEKGFGNGLSNDDCNRNGCVVKAEGAFEISWGATSISCWVGGEVVDGGGFADGTDTALECDCKDDSEAAGRSA